MNKHSHTTPTTYTPNPFGMLMPDRSFTAGEYKFGFNGQEKDDDILGAGNLMTAQFWEYDSRLGRRWNLDPVVKPWESGYACFSNNPILFVDILGNDTSFLDHKAFEDFNQVYSTIGSKISGYQNQLNDLKQNAEDKGWSEKKLNRKSEAIQNHLNDWEQLKTAFDQVINSSQCFQYSTNCEGMDINQGGTTHQVGTYVRVKFHAGQLGSLVHETRHAYGFLLKEWDYAGGHDYEDEYLAYKFEMIWDKDEVLNYVNNLAYTKYPDDPDRRNQFTLIEYIISQYADKVDFHDFKQHYVQ